MDDPWINDIAIGEDGTITVVGATSSEITANKPIQDYLVWVHAPAW